jgi:hypothetical protein
VAVIRAAAFVGLAACAAPVVDVAPVIDKPTDDDGAPSAIDGLTVAVAHAGSDLDLSSASFAPGGGFTLSDVPFGDDLVVHLSAQIGAVPAAYGRTCTFAIAADGEVPHPHLWFARNVSFGTVAVTPQARIGGFAIVHPSGAVLIGGERGATTAIERFDPRRGVLDALGELAERTGAAAARIGAGDTPQIAVVGGALPGGAPSGLLELVDVSATGPARIDRVDDDRLARTGATATTLSDGRVIVIGGRRASGEVAGDLTELSTSAAGTELRTARVTLAHPRAEHTATRLGGDVGAPVLIVGGVGPTGPIEAAELWKPLSGDLADPTTFARPMKIPRRGHRAELLPDGSVLVIGGLDAAGQPVRTLERFTVDGGFAIAGELPASAAAVELTATALPDGRILIAGGRLAPGSPAVDTAVIARLDLIDGTVDVVQTNRMAVARAGHHAALLCDGTVLVSGGTDDPTAAERYNPPPQGRR